jgi:bacillithiol biosynthesis cysteine-adding enzyme BshC
MFTVDFNKLPNFSQLFLDYVSIDGEKNGTTKKFFFADFKDKEEIFKVIDDKLHNYNANRYFDKNTLIDILKRQNMSFGGNENTASNIELLKNENTFAVVTGQQVGLYTGSLYTILKTVTAIKLAEELKVKFPQFNFVPVFWLESEDHDLEESNHIYAINMQNELVRIGFESENNEEDETGRNAKPVGSIKFDEKINEINEQLNNVLMETEYKAKLLGKIKEYYQEGNNYKTAFSQFMNWIFKDYGLVFVDPGDADIKKLLTPVFEKELNTAPKMCEAIIDISADLEKHYDLQVKPKVINLFYIHNGNRLLLEPRDNNRYALKNSKKRFGQEELLNILFENPENFSPNVVLRPLCQDYLLPTVAYIGGPSEVSYFAQLKPAYEHYDITMPVIYPRTSVSIIESKINKFIKNFEIDFPDIFDQKKLVNKVIAKLSEIKVEDEFLKVYDELNRIFYDMKNLTANIDKTLMDTVDNQKEKIIQSLEMFKGKLINAQLKKSETTTNQLDKVTNNIFPNNTLQERIVNITYFINKYDDMFVKKLFEEIDINKFAHQVMEM